MDSVALALVAILAEGAVGLALYLIQNHLTQKRELEAKYYEMKRTPYENLIRKLIERLHTVQTLQQPTSLQYKSEIDQAVNVLRLYASDETNRALNSYLDSGKTGNADITLQSLILCMRKDLNPKTTLNPTDMTLFRAV